MDAYESHILTPAGVEDTVWYCMVLYGTVRYCTVLFGTVRYCTVLYGTVRYCMVLYGTVVSSTRGRRRLEAQKHEPYSYDTSCNGHKPIVSYHSRIARENRQLCVCVCGC
jgi:hypothetical protein